MPEEPVDLFLDWYKEAINRAIPEYDIMTLATVAENRPSARIVLLKSADRKGFVFFTNYDSRKGKELDENPGQPIGEDTGSYQTASNFGLQEKTGYTTG